MQVPRRTMNAGRSLGAAGPLSRRPQPLLLDAVTCSCAPPAKERCAEHLVCDHEARDAEHNHANADDEAVDAPKTSRRAQW